MCIYICFIKFNFSFYYFARPLKLQSFNFNRAEIKAVCVSVKQRYYCCHALICIVRKPNKSPQSALHYKHFDKHFQCLYGGTPL